MTLGSHQQDLRRAAEPNANLVQVEANEPETDGWYEAKAASGDFTILLSGLFNEFTQTATLNGNMLKVHIVGMVTVTGVKYSATAMM